MTVSDIHKAFKVQMDKNTDAIAFGGCPAFLPEEIDLFLNQAYKEVVNTKFTGHNILQQPFEQSVKRTADLEKLVRTDKDVDLLYLDSSSNVLTLNNFSDTRMFYVDCVLNFGNQKANCRLIDHSNTKRFLQTYDNTPWVQIPVAVLEDGKLLIYIDPISMTASSYSCDITYVKYPQVIDINNPLTDLDEIPESVIYEVINRAVSIALENIESQRAQSKVTLNNLAE